MGAHSTPVEGVIGAYQGDNLTIKVVLVAFTSCALYSALELIFIVLSKFKAYRGLYFWSLLITASLGVIPDAVGLILKYFKLAPIQFAAILSTVGWYVMVIGQSLVLYSRLHLMVISRRLLRFTLYMIIIDAVLIGGPQWVLTLGSLFSSNPEFAWLFSIWEKVQLSVFLLQEVFISSVFIVATVRLLRLYPLRSQHRTDIMHELLGINVIIILMDITLLVLEFNQLFILQTTLKTFFYATKLKLEIAVLSRLASFVTPNGTFRPVST